MLRPSQRVRTLDWRFERVLDALMRHRANYQMVLCQILACEIAREVWVWIGRAPAAGVPEVLEWPTGARAEVDRERSSERRERQRARRPVVAGVGVVAGAALFRLDAAVREPAELALLWVRVVAVIVVEARANLRNARFFFKSAFPMFVPSLSW